MSINAATSSVSNTSSTNAMSNSQGSDSAKKSTTDSSFKQEMEKVSSTEKTKEKDIQKTEDNKKVIDNTESKKVEKELNDEQSISNIVQNDDIKFASLSMNDANFMLTNDIARMISSVENIDGYKPISQISGTICLDFADTVNISESDAEFFVNLTKNDDVSTKAVIAQAQAAVENGAELNEVKQNVKISETLLNAINIARQNNQPLRINFDQNVAVILRIGKDGSFAANFIPGDKVVEQYLKNNIESLKSSFNEQDIPYTDLSYSNRGSKQQKEQQRKNNKE